MQNQKMILLIRGDEREGEEETFETKRGSLL